MNELWKTAEQRVTELGQREKILLLLTGLIIIPGILEFFLIQPLRDAGNQWRQQTEAINQSMVSYSTQQNELLVQIEKDPAMDLERRIEGLEKSLGIAQKALLKYTDTLIAPQRMATVLENMLHQKGRLELVSLQNLPVAPLFQGQDSGVKDIRDDTAGQKSREAFGLYRHGIQMVFRGNYMTTKDYLTHLEQLPWKFYWQSFNYEVQEYPTALVRLNIYTLSTSNWWMGEKDD